MLRTLKTTWLAGAKVTSKKCLWLMVAAAAASSGPAAWADSFAVGETDGQSPAAKELDRVMEIEQVFADASLRKGIKQSFLAYAAPDAVLFRPGPVPAVPTLMDDADDNGGLSLDWWPAMGAMARSGDMALSVGPWLLEVSGTERPPIYGYYATVWKKQPDGTWKFVIDGAGARIGSEPKRRKGSRAIKLPISKEARSVGSAAAFDEVRNLEERLAGAAMGDAHAAVSSLLTADAWVMGSIVEPEGRRGSAAAEIVSRPARLRFQLIGGDASAGADFAYTYGLAESLDPSMPKWNATYLHVWQRREGEWRLIFEGVKHRTGQ